MVGDPVIRACRILVEEHRRSASVSTIEGYFVLARNRRLVGMMQKRLLSAIAGALALATLSSTAWSQDDYRMSRGYGSGNSAFTSYQNGLISQSAGAPPPAAGGGNWVDSFALPPTAPAVQPFQQA